VSGIPGYTDYQAELKAVTDKYRKQMAPYDVALKTCITKCADEPAGEKRDICERKCDQIYRSAVDPIQAAEDRDSSALTTKYVNVGVILQGGLIITDRKNAALAKNLQTGIWARAPIEVHTADELITELRRDQASYFLMLVFSGDKDGRILVDGDPLFAHKMTGLKRWVNDQTELRGNSDGDLAPSLERELKKMKGPGSFQDKWDVLPQLPPKPRITVDVDAQNDPRTHKIDGLAGAAGLTHFVTVQSTQGSVRLRASVAPNTPENQKAVSWSGVKPVSGDPLAVSISRGKSKKVPISVSVKGGNTVKLVVWVVWCELTPRYKSPPASPLDGQKRGVQKPAAAAPNITIRAAVDWYLTIDPRQVITDADRPALELQPRQDVPGPSVRPDPFCGWEVAGDTRQLVQESPPGPGGPTKTAYRWPAGDAEGDSFANKKENPYDLANPTPGWPSRSDFEFSDTPPKGLTRGIHWQARIFARVQLRDTWYRCSDFRTFRFRGSAKWSSGKWGIEPKTTPFIKLDNAGAWRP